MKAFVVALAGAAIAGCVTTAPMRGRMGPQAIGVGFSHAYAPGQVALVAPNGSRREFDGNLGARSFEPEQLKVVPPRVVARVQVTSRCDDGVEAGWEYVGDDVRCALPGTDDWVGISAGVRAGFWRLERPWREYQLRLAADLVKPTAARLAPSASLGLSWGQHLYEATLSDFFNRDTVYLGRRELRVEAVLQTTVRMRRVGLALGAAPYVVAWAATPVRFACRDCVNAVEFSQRLGVYLMADLLFGGP